MKYKVIFSLFLFACLYSCDQSEIMDLESPDSALLEEGAKCSDFAVGVETAKYAAEILFNTEVKEMKPIVYQRKDTVMYVANFEKGWALLSADVRAKAILVSAKEGSFEQQESNQGTAMLVNKLVNELLELKRNREPVLYSELQNNDDYVLWHNLSLGYKAQNEGLTDSESNANVMYKVSRSQIQRPERPGSRATRYLARKLVKQENEGTTYRLLGDRLMTKWGQEYEWNFCLPQVPNPNDKNEKVYPMVGCTAVAMGQVIYYAHYKLNTPTWLYHGCRVEGFYKDKKNYNLKYVQGQYVDNSPRWDLMAKNKYDFYERRSYVAEFFADLDWRLKMDYSYDGSGADVSKDVMNEYGLTFDEGGFDSKIVEQNLRNSRPVIITSYETKSTSRKWVFWKTTKYGGGHTWVIDGLSERTTNIKNIYEWRVVTVENNDNKTRLNPNLRPNEVAVYSSLSDVYQDFDEVIEYDRAIKMGMQPGQQETSTLSKSIRKFLMNWGGDGLCDDNEYSLSATQWDTPFHSYKYNTMIFYNLRKK